MELIAAAIVVVIGIGDGLNDAALLLRGGRQLVLSLVFQDEGIVKALSGAFRGHSRLYDDIIVGSHEFLQLVL